MYKYLVAVYLYISYSDHKQHIFFTFVYESEKLLPVCP